jgi:hypothetical protein
LIAVYPLTTSLEPGLSVVVKDGRIVSTTKTCLVGSAKELQTSDESTNLMVPVPGMPRALGITVGEGVFLRFDLARARVADCRKELAASDAAHVVTDVLTMTVKEPKCGWKSDQWSFVLDPPVDDAPPPELCRSPALGRQVVGIRTAPAHSLASEQWLGSAYSDGVLTGVVVPEFHELLAVGDFDADGRWDFVSPQRQGHAAFWTEFQLANGTTVTFEPSRTLNRGTVLLATRGHQFEVDRGLAGTQSVALVKNQQAEWVSRPARTFADPSSPRLTPLEQCREWDPNLDGLPKSTARQCHFVLPGGAEWDPHRSCLQSGFIASHSHSLRDWQCDETLYRFDGTTYVPHE